jgi:hypothetical protein
VRGPLSIALTSHCLAHASSDVLPIAREGPPNFSDNGQGKAVGSSLVDLCDTALVQLRRATLRADPARGIANVAIVVVVLSLLCFVVCCVVVSFVLFVAN